MTNSQQKREQYSEADVLVATASASDASKWVFVAAVLIIMAAAALRIGTRGATEQPAQPISTPTPLTSYSEGGQVAFSRNGPTRDNVDIYRAAHRLDVTPATGDDRKLHSHPA